MSHLNPGVGLVVDLTKLFLSECCLLCVKAFILLKFRGSADSVLLIRVQKDPESRDTGLCQDVICASADDDAGFLRKLQDYLLLRLKDSVVRTRIGGSIVQQIIHELACPAEILSLALDIFLGEAALLGCFPDHILIIIRDSQLLRQSLRHGASIRGILTADRNHRIP